VIARRLTSLELDQELQISQIGAVDIAGCATKIQVGSDCVVGLLDVGGSIAGAGINRSTLLNGDPAGQSSEPESSGEKRQKTSHYEGDGKDCSLRCHSVAGFGALHILYCVLA